MGKNTLTATKAKRNSQRFRRKSGQSERLFVKPQGSIFDLLEKHLKTL